LLLSLLTRLFLGPQASLFGGAAQSFLFRLAASFFFSLTASSFGGKSLSFFFRATASLFFSTSPSFIFDLASLFRLGAHFRFDLRAQARLLFGALASLFFGPTPSLFFGTAPRGLFRKTLRLSRSLDARGFASLHALDLFFDGPESHLRAPAQFVFLGFLAAFCFQIASLFFGTALRGFVFRQAKRVQFGFVRLGGLSHPGFDVCAAGFFHGTHAY
jgi:hypothetical protein